MRFEVPEGLVLPPALRAQLDTRARENIRRALLG